MEATDFGSTQKHLPATEYTVAWICALTLELNAARAMLDEVHGQNRLELSDKDKNEYILGSICGHNVAITRLEECGLTPATVTAKNIQSTFTRLTNTLLVGIGGGVPQPGFDIRLGDIVVGKSEYLSPAIVQYDYGNIEVEGLPRVKDYFNTSSLPLLRAVKDLASKHKIGSNHMLDYITGAIRSFTEAGQIFVRPRPEMDVLFDASCDHEGKTVCTECGPTAVVTRNQRDNRHPDIFYGTIGSINQVIKHGRTRDKIARIQGNRVLCFETEAAGVINMLPCLVIRGIRDYCDSHKHKYFQYYAAITAAAYAKELLSMITPLAQLNASYYIQSFDGIDHCTKIMAMLQFPDTETRQASIRPAHNETCEWLIKHEQYVKWLKLKDDTRYRGLIWLKGKPGAGKSTAIRFLIEQIQRQRPMPILISFFYKGSSHGLASSIEGMYRSLIYQLLEKVQHLRELLKTVPLPNDGESFSIDTLQDLFRMAVESLGTDDLFCFIDALDECHNEDRIRDMVEVFEEFGRLTSDGRLNLHACLSSRHYPKITSRVFEEIILEHQKGHSDDIVSYLKAELEFICEPKFEKVKADIVCKSNGVFLWVKHVVRRLKEQEDTGQILPESMLQTLEEIPTGLDDLFRDILRRSMPDLPNLQVLFKWILHAKRLMTKNELYYALWMEDKANIGLLQDHDETKFTNNNSYNYLLNRSKGLIELTLAPHPARNSVVRPNDKFLVVKFIHESLRELLLQPGSLRSIEPGFEELHQTRCHETLKIGCNRYLAAVQQNLIEETLERTRHFQIEVDRRFPFLEYVTNNILYHAEQAQQAGCDQTFFLGYFAVEFWTFMHNLHSSWRTGYYSTDSTLIEILINENLPNLLACCMKGQNSFVSSSWDVIAKVVQNCRGDEISFNILYDAMNAQSMPYTETVKDYFEALQEISKALPDKDLIKMRNFLKTGFDWTQVAKSRQSSLDKALHIASQYHCKRCVTFLLKRGAHANSVIEQGRERTPLHWAVETGCIEVVRNLIDNGGQVDYRDNEGMTPLMCAAAIPRHESSFIDIAILLLDHQANINALSRSKKTALYFSIEAGSDSFVETLMRKGADWRIASDTGLMPLDLAALLGKVEKVKILTKWGAYAGRSSTKRSVLHLAAAHGHTQTCRFLLDKGLSPNDRDMYGRTPLHRAMRKAPTELIKTLIDSSAQIELANAEGYSPLHQAARSGNTNAVRILLDQGVQVDAKNPDGKTALFLAVRAGHDRAIHILLNAGADMEVVRTIKTMRRSTKMALLAHKNATLHEHDFSDDIVGADPASNADHLITVDMGKPKTTRNQRGTRTDKSQVRHKKEVSIEKVLDQVDLQWLFLPHKEDNASIQETG